MNRNYFVAAVILFYTMFYYDVNEYGSSSYFYN